MNQQLVFAADECAQCGQPYWPDDHYCSACGIGLRPVAAESPHCQLTVPRYVIPAPPVKSAATTLLGSRAAVWCVLLVAGPMGLPLMWFSPRFSTWFKILITILLFALTVLLPLLVSYYFLDIAVQPLLNAFEEQG